MKEIKGSTVRRRYARLPLALALGALVLTPAFIGTAEAGTVDAKGETGITLSGDARLRGYWRENAEYTDADNTNRVMQHRMRIAFDAKAAGGTSLHTRFHMAGSDTPSGTTGSIDQWGGADEQYAGSRNQNVMADYLYVRVPVGPGSVTLGRQVINYGHKFRVWDGRGDRLTYAQKLSDEMTVFGYYQKINENSGDVTSPGKDEDHNLYAAGTAFSSGNLAGNVLIQHQTQEWKDGVDGQELIGFVTLKMDPLTVEFEGHFTNGELFENADEDNGHKLYLGAAFKMGDTTLTAGLAYSTNGIAASSGHFEKISMFHNTSGGHGLGRTVFGGLFGAATDVETAIGVGVTQKLSPSLTLGARAAMLAAENLGGAEVSATVVDASMAYKVNASTTYHIDAIYAMPDDFTADDEAYWGLSNRFEIKF